jgi:hypothetical protein
MAQEVTLPGEGEADDPDALAGRVAPDVTGTQRRSFPDPEHSVPSTHPPPGPPAHGSPAAPAGEHEPHAGTVTTPPSGGVPKARVHRVLAHCASSAHDDPSGRAPGATMHAAGRAVALHGRTWAAAAQASIDAGVKLDPVWPRRARQLVRYRVRIGSIASGGGAMAPQRVPTSAAKR